MGNAIDSLKALISARQNNRILRLTFPNNDGPRCEFVVEKLDAFEGMSRDFEFSIEILSNSAKIELKDIQGKLLRVELVQKGGTLRYFSGYCFSFRLKRAENIAFMKRSWRRGSDTSPCAEIVICFTTRTYASRPPASSTITVPTPCGISKSTAKTSP